MKIAIIGASKDRTKFSNKAVRAYKENDHVVFPVNPSEREIEGLKCYASVREIPLEIDAVIIKKLKKNKIKTLLECSIRAIDVNPDSL